MCLVDYFFDVTMLLGTWLSAPGGGRSSKQESIVTAKKKKRKEKKLFGIGKNDLANRSQAQPTYSALLLRSLQMWHHLKGNKQPFQPYKTYCQEALLQQRKNTPSTNFLFFFLFTWLLLDVLPDIFVLSTRFFFCFLISHSAWTWYTSIHIYSQHRLTNYSMQCSA